MDKEEYEKFASIYETIASQLIEKKNISRYEYYLLGGVRFKNASRVIYMLHRMKLITIQEYEILRNYINKQLKMQVTYRNKDFIFATLYQFGDTIISIDEKNNIWNNLCNIIDEMDIDELVFSGAVRAYAIENGLIKKEQDNQKRLVKRK